MKKIFLAALSALLVFSACNTTKNLAGVKSLLNAKWNLQSIADYSDIAGLYNGKMPFLSFDTDAMRVTGNTGCNSLTGPFNIEQKGKLNFGALATTKMACPGNGEQVFSEALSKVTNYKISDNVLTLLNNETPIMEFVKSE